MRRGWFRGSSLRSSHLNHRALSLRSSHLNHRALSLRSSLLNHRALSLVEVRAQRASKPRRSLALTAGLLSATVLLTSCADDPSTVAACRVETVADDRLADCDVAAGEADLPDLTLPCLGGDGDASLAEVGGPAVVNFWGSWCGPCRKEMPVIEDFHATYGDQVTVLGVAIDTYPEAAAEFAADKDVTYPSLLDGCGEVEESDLALGPGLPQTVFVAADGSIVRHSGEIESVDELVGLTETHLGIELERSPA